MCIANVVVPRGKAGFIENGKEEEFLDKITKVEVEEDGLKLEHYYYGERSIKAKIKEIDFVNSKIVLEKE